ncbi:MAG: hypothetical protein Q7S27_00165 [Nanoarchaeota archaeon]|nr:hypothetical protein [Nanoarchaeota archaeon]
MAVNIHNLIAAINPDLYCDLELKEEVKKIAKEKGYLAAAEKAKPRKTTFIDLSQVAYVNNPYHMLGIKNPIEKHSLAYDNFSQALEPIYFWLVDYINKEYKNSEKLLDNFVTSPGSSQFSEMGGRATRMQEEAMKMMQTSGTIIKSILNIVYDLKEFKIRLSLYDDLKSNDKSRKNAAVLSLKQIWLDQVDAIKRGTTSIKGLAQQFDYVTLIDAFMVADSLDRVKDLDLNDRVKRILEQRLAEFFKWIEESERELRKRFEIEKLYLKNQVNSVRLYARWIKPYLKAAQALEQRASPTSALVNTFNTTLMELTLMGKRAYKMDDDIAAGALPPYYRNKFKKVFNTIALVELKYRSVPERLSQGGGYGFRGRVDIDFTSYALTDDEVKVMKKELEKDDLGDLMKMIEGTTDDSLAKIQVDLDEFMDDKKDEKKDKKSSDDVNPFTALFSIFKPEKKDKEEIPKDTQMEKIIRNQTILYARAGCRKLYNSYKDTIDMPSFY